MNTDYLQTNEFTIIQNAIFPDIYIIRHDPTGFYNITKSIRFIKSNKQVKHWVSNKSTVLLFEECRIATKFSIVDYELSNGIIKGFEGTYVHPILYDHFMMWLSHKYAIAYSMNIHYNVHQNIIKQITCKKQNCQSIGCQFMIDSKSYHTHCKNCFNENNSDDQDYDTIFNKIVLTSKESNLRFKEKKIMNIVKDTYKRIILDQPIDYKQYARRPDGLLKCDTHNIIVEVDEYQHTKNNYSDSYEEERIREIYAALDEKPLTIIRFNPDSYNDMNNGLFDIDKKTGDMFIVNDDKFKEAINELIGIIHQSHILDHNSIKIIKIRYDTTTDNDEEESKSD